LERRGTISLNATRKRADIGLLLARVGVEAVWLSAGLCFAAFGSLFALRRGCSPDASSLPTESLDTPSSIPQCNAYQI
jgi:hypothetical protein